MLINLHLLPGTSATFIYTACVTCTQRYFVKRRTLATSFVVVGISAAAFVWPPVAQYLIFKYGWRATLALIGAVYLNIAPLGWLFKHSPLSKQRCYEVKQLSCYEAFK